jgi:ankyrin repeat protein
MSDTLSQDEVREFVIAAHGDMKKVQAMLEATPALLNVNYEWAENDFETPIQAAAHVGNVPIAEYLLNRGAPLSLCTAAMLGRLDDVTSMLVADPAAIHERGAHGIPLLAHAAWSGSSALLAMLVGKGASDKDDISFALGNAVTAGHLDVVRWLLKNTEPDLGWKDFRGKTPLEIAQESGFVEIEEMLAG